MNRDHFTLAPDDVREIRHFHLFCGLGGGAKGFNKTSPRVGNMVGKMRCIGGIDVNAPAIRDFERFAGVRGTVLDLFDRDQFTAFHGKEPPAGWREAGPADIRAAAGGEYPHSDIVNFFRVVRDRDMRAHLIEACVLTPYAREEFELAWEPAQDPVERARCLVVRAQMGFGSAGATKGTTGFRIDAKREYETAQHTWAKYPDTLEALGTRITGVMIENKPAIEIIGNHDTPETLFYVDPPYVHETRVRITGKGSARGYRFEMSDSEHLELIQVLNRVEGMVVLSGYSHPIYDEALRGWERHEKEARISASRGTAIRTECVWLNQACADALHSRQITIDFGLDRQCRPEVTEITPHP